MRFLTASIFVLAFMSWYGTGSGSDRVVRQAASLSGPGYQTNWLSADASTSWQFVGHESVGSAATASFKVTGKIELANSKLKSRDAGGIVVWLKPADGSTPRGGAKQRKTINQRDKRFLPHVVAIEVGSEVDFPNDDPFFHNVFSIFNGKRFDLGLYASGETRPVNFNRPGISYIFCNIHPKMSAVVLALDTPHFAVSDKAGGFTINNVPTGEYRLSVWHERAKPETLSAISRNFQVGAEDFNLGTISISEEGYVPRPHPNKHGQEYDSQQNKPGYRKP